MLAGDLLGDESGAGVRKVTKRMASGETRMSAGFSESIADHAPVMLWVTDANGYCTYLNRRW